MEYELRVARNLIWSSYDAAGLKHPIESFDRSFASDQLGEVPRGWNEGLIRYLDECIGITNTVQYCVIASVFLAKGEITNTQLVLINQIKGNMVAIRTLATHGQDNQARILLRAMYENNLALCRSLVDKEFSDRFRSIENPLDANRFWHKYLSKSKTEKFLIMYNDSADITCPLVVGDHFSEIYEKLGISAHPSFFASNREYIASISDLSDSKDLLLGSEATSEFVLVGTANIILSSLIFLSEIGPQIYDERPWIIRGTIYDGAKTNHDVLKTTGKIASIMFLLLVKWTNRQKPNFDADLHY